MKQKSFFYKASIFFNGTSKSFDKTKNSKTVMDLLMHFTFAATKYTPFGARDKKRFISNEHIVSSIEDAIKQRHSELSNQDVLEEIKHYFKYVGQTHKRFNEAQALKAANADK